METNDVLQQPCTRAFARVSMFTESVSDTNMFELCMGRGVGGGGGIVVDMKRRRRKSRSKRRRRRRNRRKRR